MTVADPVGSDVPIRDLADPHRVIESVMRCRTGRVIDLRTDSVAMSDGTATRDVVVHPGAVGIIAVNDADEILLLQQYRHPVGRLLWEPPAGLLDIADEPPLIAAKRELYEEAHLEAGNWRVLVDLFTSPGMTDEAIRLFLARDVRPSTQVRFAGQFEELDMPLRWVPLAQAVSAVLDGRLHNPIAVSGILAAAAARSEPGWDSLRSPEASWPEMSSFVGSSGASD